MKERLRKSLRGQPKLLTLTLTHSERLDYTRSEWLAGGPGKLFLPFRYEGQEKGARLSYDVLGTQRLPAFLKAAITTEQYGCLLRAVNDVCATCIDRGIPTSDLWLEPEGVFVTAEGQPRFVLVPLAGNMSVQHGSPLSLLSWLGSARNVRMVVEEDLRHVSAVGDWAQRQSVFAPERFERFLAGELSPVAAAPAPRGQAGVTAASMPGLSDLRDSRREGDGASLPGIRARAALNPLDLLGDETVHMGPAPAVERVARRTFEVSSEASSSEPLGDASGDTSSLGSDSLGLARDDATTGAVDAEPSGDPGHGASPQPAATPVCLVRERDGLRLEVGRGPLSMGRSAKCDLHVGGNPSVSRVHATVSATGQGIAICDQGSANGTFVDGSRIESKVVCEVARGETFLLGDECFRVV